MAETGKPTDNTVNLKGAFLGASDLKNLLPAGEPSSLSIGTNGSEFSETGNAYELRSQALAATTAPDKETSIVLSSSQQSRREAVITQTRKREEHQLTQLTLAEQARQLSERLAQQIATLEAAFESEMGDAWREKIANRVMDPDEIPRRRDGESMQDYRQRLETVLIATMIHVNGNIRPEYASSDDPEVRRYAAWAQAQHQKGEVDAYLERRGDPSLSQIDREALDIEFRSSSSFAKIQQASADHRAPTDVTNDLGNALDEQQDAEVTAVNVEASSFEI